MEIGRSRISFFRLKYVLIGVFSLLMLASVLHLPRLSFSFDFAAFLPKGDPEYQFYDSFCQKFGPDDSFLMVAIEREAGVFDPAFLAELEAFTTACDSLPFVAKSLSLTNLSYPIHLGIGTRRLPVLHWRDSSRYASDWAKIRADAKLIHHFIDEEAKSVAILLQTKDSLQQRQSLELMQAFDSLRSNFSFEKSHVLGRAYFFTEIVKLQRGELLQASILAMLVMLVLMTWIYRKPLLIAVILLTLLTGFLLFLGLMALLEREFNALSAFYPFLLLIVGTSDIIHLLEGYKYQLAKGLSKAPAMQQALRKVGLSLMVTSLTTAVGLLSLLTASVVSLQEFGLNAALGVGIAFLTCIFFAAPMLLLLPPQLLIQKQAKLMPWGAIMDRLYVLSRKNGLAILMGSGIVLLLCTYYSTLIPTNFRVASSLPKSGNITEDFRFFQEKYNGFRSLEIAITAPEGRKIDDFAIIQQVNQLEEHLLRQPAITSVSAPSDLFKLANRAFHGNRPEAAVLVTDSIAFEAHRKWLTHSGIADQMRPWDDSARMGRAICKVLDIGSDSMQVLHEQLRHWISEKLDSSLLSAKLTGKGLLLDKSARLIKADMAQGLLFAIVWISLLLGLLLRSWRLAFLTLIPNLLPLLIAGGILGILKIPLETPTTVVFALVLGIAVDDSIHFLSAFRRIKAQGLALESSLRACYQQSGKAILLSSLMLCAGFLMLLFAKQLTLVTVALLLSVALASAVAFDLLLMPVLIRWVYRK